jgi:hypothetical protein
MTNTEPWQVWKLDGGECLVYLHPRFVELLPVAANMPVAEFMARLKKPKRKRNPAKPKAAKPARAEPAASPRMTFGKYKGETLADIVMQVPWYAKWLVAQPWFAAKFPEHNAYLDEQLMMMRNADDGPTAA